MFAAIYSAWTFERFPGRLLKFPGRFFKSPQFMFCRRQMLQGLLFGVTERGGKNPSRNSPNQRKVSRETFLVNPVFGYPPYNRFKGAVRFTCISSSLLGKRTGVTRMRGAGFHWGPFCAGTPPGRQARWIGPRRPPHDTAPTSPRSHSTKTRC